jgi:hypothetical protein
MALHNLAAFLDKKSAARSVAELANAGEPVARLIADLSGDQRGWCQVEDEAAPRVGEKQGLNPLIEQFSTS